MRMQLSYGVTSQSGRSYADTRTSHMDGIDLAAASKQIPKWGAFHNRRVHNHKNGTGHRGNLRVLNRLLAIQQTIEREREHYRGGLGFTSTGGTDQPGESPLRGPAARRTRTGRGGKKRSAAAQSVGVVVGRGCARGGGLLLCCAYPLRS
jgi:hypothetical protein